MARTADSDRGRTADAIREAAAGLFFRRGYEATSLREVASSVGLRVGSLYNHIRSKDELLSAIMTNVLDDLDVAMNQAVGAPGLTDIDRLRAAISCNIRYHAEHAREVFIGNSELRSLNPEHRQLIVARRRAYERRIRDLVGKVVEPPGTDTHLQTYALLAIGVHVSTWYRPGGRMHLDEIVDVHTRIGLRRLGIVEIDTRQRLSECRPDRPVDRGEP